jgi:hypothetical protein
LPHKNPTGDDKKFYIRKFNRDFFSSSSIEILPKIRAKLIKIPIFFLIGVKIGDETLLYDFSEILTPEGGGRL